jgi:hypothetical protein
VTGTILTFSIHTDCEWVIRNLSLHTQTIRFFLDFLAITQSGHAEAVVCPERNSADGDAFATVTKNGVKK